MKTILRAILVAAAACQMVSPALAADAKSDVPRSVPDTKNMSGAQLRELIATLCVQIDKLEDENKSLKLHEKLRAAEAAADAAAPASAQPQPKPQPESQAAPPIDDNTGANATSRSWTIKVISVVVQELEPIQSEIDQQETKLDNANRQINTAQTALRNAQKTSDTSGDAELTRWRSLLTMVEGEKRTAVHRIQQLHDKLEKARDTTTVVASTDAGDPIIITARQQCSAVARVLQNGQTTRVQGLVIRTTPTLEVLATAIIPVEP